MPDSERKKRVLDFQLYNFEPRSSGRTTPKFHDNDVRSIRIIPAQMLSPPSIVEITFHDSGENIDRILKLKGCANLRFAIDFDILSNNSSNASSSAGQTSNVEIKDQNECIEQLIKQGVADWNVEYPSNERTAASYKFEQLHELIFVKILLHGGTLEIAARDFKIIEVSDP